MKKTLLAAILVLVACGEKKAETPAADTSAAAPSMAPTTTPTTPPPATPDTAMMPHDTGRMHPDTAMARDTATQKAPKGPKGPKAHKAH